MIRPLLAAAVLAALLASAPAGAMPGPIPPAEALLVTPAGVVWSDAGTLRTGSGTVMARGLSAPTPAGRDGWVAAAGATGLLAGRVGHTLRRVSSGPPTAPGCRGWRASTAIGAGTGAGAGPRVASFAVAGDRLTLAGVPACPGRVPSTPRPLFTRTLPAGPWRVVRRVPAAHEPALVAAGHWLAVGVPASGGMTVSVLDRDGARERYRVAGLAPGALALDASGRLVVSSPENASSGDATVALRDPTRLAAGGALSVAWASPSRPAAHRLGDKVATPAAIDAGRIVYATVPTADGTGALRVADLVHGGTRTLVGTRYRYRDVDAVGLLGTRLVRVEADAPLPPPGSCSASTPTTLRLVASDAATTPPLAPPPAPVPPSDPTVCGPAIA